MLRLVSLAAPLALAAFFGLEGRGVASRSLPEPVTQGSVAAIRADDTLVLKAVVEHTLLPEVERSNSGRNRQTVVLIEDRSSPLCAGGGVAPSPCRIPDHWQQFLVPNPSRGWPGMVVSEQRRRELIASLEARNASRQVLPPIDHPAVVMIAVERSEEALRSYRERAGGFSRLSLPGYAADGHALVYGSFYCGNLCGKSWLFLLRNRDSRWHVESAVVTSIS